MKTLRIILSRKGEPSQISAEFSKIATTNTKKKKLKIKFFKVLTFQSIQVILQQSYFPFVISMLGLLSTNHLFALHGQIIPSLQTLE